MIAARFAPLVALVLAGGWTPPSDVPPAGPRIVITPGGKNVEPPTPEPVPVPPPKPAPLPTSVTIAGERFELLSLTGYTGKVTWDVTGPTAPVVVLFEKAAGSSATGWRVGAAKPDRYPIGDVPTVEVYAIGVGEATISAWGVAGGNPVKLASFRVVANTAPQPPPVDPKVEPVPPTPATVTSFRVFLVYEAGATLTSQQYGVLYGKDVENALKTACNIPNASAWRRIDKDANPNSLPAGLKEAWAACKPAVTAVPCIAFQVNEKITIEPLLATQADQVTAIQKYREGK